MSTLSYVVLPTRPIVLYTRLNETNEMRTDLNSKTFIELRSGLSNIKPSPAPHDDLPNAKSYDTEAPEQENRSDSGDSCGWHSRTRGLTPRSFLFPLGNQQELYDSIAADDDC